MNTMTLWNNRIAKHGLEDAFDGLLGAGTSSSLPTTRTAADAERYTIEMDMPGVTREAVKLHIESDQLSVSASRTVKQAGQEREYVYQQRFTLPTDADSGAVKATLKDGVLTLHIGKREEAKPREIQIEVS